MTEFYTCPVLVFTSEVEGHLGLFDATHELRLGPGWARFERTALPGPGGIMAQPARDFEAITWIARIWNRLLAAHIKRGVPRATDRRRGRP